MKIVISKDGIKRELETPFGICCSVEELGHLINALQYQKYGMEHTGATYGWMTIDLSHPDSCPPNTEPRRWNE